MHLNINVHLRVSCTINTNEECTIYEKLVCKHQKNKTLKTSNVARNFENEVNAEETQAWLQHHKEPWQFIKIAWQHCIQYRMSDILNAADNNLISIFKRWPLFTRHSYSYDLVSKK